MSEITKNIIRWWQGSFLPDAHVFPELKKKTKNIKQFSRILIRQWLIHPVKRRLAKYYLLLLKKASGLTIIAITGSAGKTTTKEMVTSILRQNGKTVSLYANIDPVFNIPSAILKCRLDTKYLVLEMGVEYPGEMDFYLWLARPDIGIITNIYPTHTLFFKDIEGVYKEKSKLVLSLDNKKIAILNSDDERLNELADRLAAEVIYYGKVGRVKAENIITKKSMSTHFTLIIDNNKLDVQLSSLGDQFVSNALASAACGMACKINIKNIVKGLEAYEKPKHRMDITYTKNGSMLVDDSYNNNPEAARSALGTFSRINSNKKIIVFGDMLELGKSEAKYHQQIGNIIAGMDIYGLITVGPLAALTAKTVSKKRPDVKVHSIAKTDDAIPLVEKMLTQETAVLIKGSRSVGLDKLTEELLAV